MRRCLSVSGAISIHLTLLFPDTCCCFYWISFVFFLTLWVLFCHSIHFNTLLPYSCLSNIASLLFSKSCGQHFLNNRSFTYLFGAFISTVSAPAAWQWHDLALHMAEGVIGWETREQRERNSREVAVKTAYSKLCPSQAECNRDKRREQTGTRGEKKQQETHWGKLFLYFPH